MGKYTRKGKITGDVVAVMEVSSQSSLGVRTRAKTLALQRQHASASSPSGTSDYLQLRNRRLVRPPLLADAKNPSRHHDSRPNSLGEVNSSSDCRALELDLDAGGGLGVEASFGENNLGLEAKERGTRESTPCSLIRDPDAIRTPGSTTRRVCSTQSIGRAQNAMVGSFPTSMEMEEFFAYAERQQQTLFAEKYNFDIVNDLPLPGRYDWVTVNP